MKKETLKKVTRIAQLGFLSLTVVLIILEILEERQNGKIQN